MDISHFDLQRRGATEHVDPEDLPLSFLVQLTTVSDCNLAAQFEPDLLPTAFYDSADPFSESAPNDGHFVAQFSLASAQLPARCPLGCSRAFSAKVLHFLLSLDVSATRSRVVTCKELLAAFEALNLGSMPHARIVQGVTQHEETNTIVAGGLVRHTIASASLTLRKCIVQILLHFGVVSQTGHANRVDLGLFFNVWAIRIGWPDHVEAVARVIITRWFESRPARKAADVAKPM